MFKTKPVHSIKNFDTLATSPLRKRVLQVAEAGLASLDAGAAIRRTVKYNAKKELLEVAGKKYDLKNFKRVICVGLGSAGLDGASELQNLLLDKITCGFVIDLKGDSLGNITCKTGTHPHISKVNIEATKELLALLSDLTAQDLVLCIVSGGAGSLLCYPHEMTCEAEISIMAALSVKGASAQEIDTVLKHVSKVKGGNFARLMYPATVASLVFADTAAGDIGMVASGPTVPDTTTIAGAADVLKKYDILEACQMPACKLLETPKEKKYFEKVQNVFVVSAQQALNAMKDEAEHLGYDAKFFSSQESNAASGVLEIVKSGRPGQVTLGIFDMKKSGSIAEAALAVLPLMKHNQVLGILSGSGFIMDSGSLVRAVAARVDSEMMLDNNQPERFFEELGDSIHAAHPNFESIVFLCA